jgi:uncharacterized protein
MSMRSGAIIASLALASVVACGALSRLDAIEPALELKWDQLVPAAPRKLPMPFFAGRGPVDIGKLGGPDDGSPAPPPLPEGRWMSVPTQPNAGPVRVVESLGGKRVHIGGYVVPLDFDATRVTDFLLVPFVGACIHVPPPPANQIIYVNIAQGFNVQGTFDPVWVTGTLNVTPTFTGLAEAGYTLEAEKVESRPKD